MPKKPAGKKIMKPPQVETENNNNNNSMDNDTTTTAAVNVAAAAAAAPSSSSTKQSPSPAKPPASSSSVISVSPFKSSPGGTTTTTTVASDHNQNRSTTNHGVPSFRNIASANATGGRNGGGGGNAVPPRNPKEYLTFVQSWLNGSLTSVWRDLDKILPAGGQSISREFVIRALLKECKWSSRPKIEDAMTKLERLLLVGREVPRYPANQKAPTLIFRVLLSRKERSTGYTFATQEMKKHWQEVTFAIMSKNLSFLTISVVHDNNATNQKNTLVSTTTGTANQHQHQQQQQSLLPAPPPPGVTMTSASQNNTGTTTTTTTATDSSSITNNPNYESLKTATKLYLDNLKNLPSGLERSSLKTLLAHSEGWQDLQMQDQFLTELATKNFIRLERDPSNPAIVKVFCNTNTNNNNNNLSGTRRERSPPTQYNNNNNNNMMATMMNSNASYPPQQYPSSYHQNSIQQQQQMYSAITNNGINNSMMSMRRNPIIFPPPLIVREGAPLMRSNPHLLVFAPPPFFVNGK